MFQVRESNSCRGERHDQNEGGQDIFFEKGSIVSQNESKEKSDEEDKVNVF
jgi:hypothetical protein